MILIDKILLDYNGRFIKKIHYSGSRFIYDNIKKVAIFDYTLLIGAEIISKLNQYIINERNKKINIILTTND